MKRQAVAVITAMLAMGACNLVCAQTYPTRPIRLVIPFPPGGNVDTFARVFARQVESDLGQPIVIDNRGGANGIVGFDIVAKAPPDGYTLMNTSIAFAINPNIYRNLPYNTEKDFAPITNYAKGLGYLLVAHPSLSANSARELIALAKVQQVRYSSAGIGNGQHLAGELFNMKAGIQMLHVPYKGGGPAMNALLSGEVQLNFPGANVALPHVKAGRLKAVGFTGDKRLASLPDVPTIAESGLPGYYFDTGWHAWFAPARTPPAIVNRVYAAMQKALQDPKVNAFLIAGGYEPKGDSPAEFGKLLREDIKRYALSETR